MTATLPGGDELRANYPSDQSALKLQGLLERQKVDFTAKAPSHNSCLDVDPLSLLAPSARRRLDLHDAADARRRRRHGPGDELREEQGETVRPGSPKIGFKDVAGVDEAVEELQEIKEFLADPRRFQASAPGSQRCAALRPPGTGKTLLARAVAGEADVPFFSISGSDFVEMFVGVGASRVRDLFKEAKEAAPCIVFVDELDAVGRHRGAGVGGVTTSVSKP